MAALFHVLRFHIVCIAALASLSFGWLLTGREQWAGVLCCALDWLLVNLWNRVADVAEDRKNGVPGTAFAERWGRALSLACSAALLLSLAAGHALWPALTPWRLAFHAIGFAYNFRVLPGRRRFKETYFWKNASSAILFLLSCQLYPAALAGFAVPLPRALFLAAFFFPLELTYEIIYDLRDVEGDRAERVPTFPVVHGLQASHRLIEALLAAAALALVIGYCAGALRLRELLLIAAPVQQALYFELRLKANPTQGECVFLTYLGAAQVLSYQIWIWAGLPLGPA